MQDYSEQIQDYVEGKLEGRELASFLEALRRDPALRDAAALRADMQEVLTRHMRHEADISELNRLLEQKRQLFMDSGQDSVSKPFFPKKVKWLGGLAAAASIVIFLMLGEPFAPDWDKLPPMPETLTRAGEQRDDWTDIKEAYGDKDFPQAITLLLSLKAAGNTDAVTSYYLGLSYIGEEDYSNARIYLEEVTAGHSVYKAEAYYFLGYVCSRQQDMTCALDQLSRVEEGSPYFKKAQLLLKKLN